MRLRPMMTESPQAKSETVLFEGHPALVPSLATLLLAIVTVGIWLLPAYIKSRGVSYRITSQRVVVETGLFGKRLEQIDLYRVNDFTVERPFLQRLMGTGSILLITMDRTTPNITIANIKTDVVALYEELRRRTEQAKAQNSVRVVDYE
jgi:uncharacterized membrane protein YdbT with pleckstrin-like domain